MSGEVEPSRPRIRPFDRERDFEGMFAVTREIVSAPPYDLARLELLDYPAKGVVAHVAETEREGVIGFCAASHPYWNAVAILDYLVVAPAHRRKRIGATLVHEVEGGLRAAGMRRVCVQTISWNVDAIRFYERLGYEERARLPRYFDDRLDDRLEMVWLDRQLDGAAAGPLDAPP